MRVLVIGQGAREHALLWKLSQSPRVTKLFASPGNGGTGSIATNIVVEGATDALVAWARASQIDLVVIGPEDPLVRGVADALRAENILVFGPNRDGAQLEASKSFSKEFMARHQIPTAGFRIFDDADAADAYVRDANRPLVVKADGLAAGKGVVVARDVAEALCAIDDMMRKRAFGDAGARVVIEETLLGEEISFHVVSDGERLLPLAAAQDHKRLRDHDEGPNTGGMGAYSPPPIFTDALRDEVMRTIVEPTFHGLKMEGIAFRGVLFVGLMVVAGKPYVLEYNVRFGDPECEVLMARFGGDVFDMLYGAARGDFGKFELAWNGGAALAVVLAAENYPGPSPKGDAITINESALSGAAVFHAGTSCAEHAVVTNGGRVLAACASGENVDAAAKTVYSAIHNAVSFRAMQYRSDIGYRARTL